MFRLLKLAAYALLGYVLYELFLGIRDGGLPGGQQQGGGQQGGGSQQGQGGGGGASQPQGQRDLNRALNEDGGRMGTLTGGGRGEMHRTADPSGTSVPHAVGRGVITP